MALRYLLVAGILLGMQTTGAGRPQALGTLWHGARGSVVITECPPGGDHDDHCRAIELRNPSGVSKLGGGYTRVALLWSRTGKDGGPDALVLGDYGGSGGDADLFAICLSSKPAFRKSGGERYDTVRVHSGRGPLRLTLPFDLEYFNGAPHAGAIIVPVPVVWTGDDFVVDLAAMTRRTYSTNERDFRALAMAEELRMWAIGNEQYRNDF